MTVREFCEVFSHNNPICVCNNDRYTMTCHVGTKEVTPNIMDWYLRFSDIADCEMIKINVSPVEQPNGGYKDKLFFVVDTDKRDFNIVDVTGAPAWMVEAVTGKSNICGECCCAG